MAEPDAKASSAGGPSAGPSKPSKPPNPVWRMMGAQYYPIRLESASYFYFRRLPNFRLKLPSRNWTIFLTVVGGWTAAVTYDRREKRRIQRKWSKLVEHLASETVPTQQLPRKLTIFLSAPPADGIVSARDHFNEYVKPILVSAALDWDAIEGRREGDVRAGLAERIRRLRQKSGEVGGEVEDVNIDDLIEAGRIRAGVTPSPEIPGDIVIGRHTWKEYVRGLHEGWLGPLDAPKQPEELPAQPAEPVAAPQEAATPSNPTSTADASPAAAAELEKPKEEERPKEEEAKPKGKKQPPPFNTTANYNDSLLSPNCPPALGPSAAIPLPHLLGFFNFPIRIYRFLNRRQVADDVGRQTAAAVLAAYQPYEAPGELAASDDDSGAQWEQQRILQHEEPEWHKTVRERKEDDKRERVWLDDMVLDPRIAERMRKFVLDADAEERANMIAKEPMGGWWSNIWPKKEEKKNLWEGLSDN